MSDTIITTYGLGGYQVFLDAEAVTTTAAQRSAVRQRVEISARDITAGTPLDIGDSANQAIRVNVVQGSFSVSSNPNVTVTTLGPNFPVVTVTGNLNAVVNNVSVTNVVSVTQNTTPWTVTYSQGTQLVAGTVTATGVTIQQATVTQGTTPWLVSATQGTTPWSVTQTSAPWWVGGTIPATLSSLTATPTLFLPVTFTSPTVTFSAGTQAVTFSAGTQVVTLTQVLASVTQGTSPWVVTYSQGLQAVTVTQLLVSATQGTSPWSVTQTSSPWWIAGTIPATLSSLTATPTLFLPVTFTNPTVTFSAGTQLVSLTTALPWAVTQSFGTLVVSLTTATPWLVTQSGAPWLVSASQGTTPWTVTYSQGTQLVSLSTALPWTVTFSQGTQLVSATQGTNPWVITFSGTQPVSLSQVVLSSNVAATTPTGSAVQVVRSLAELLVPIFQPVSTTAASATIIPGVAGKRIWVTGYHLIASSQTNVVWIDSAATPNGLTGTLAIATNSGVSAYGTIDTPLFAVVTPGNALKISQSAAGILGGVVTGYQV